jgi:4-amino-4-deoxy-L-arabinose transferase-like glycosyltransferase
MTDQGWFGWRRRVEWLALLLVVAAALALRLYGLGSFPDTVSADEADNTQDALRVIAGQPRPGGFFGLDWKPQPAYSVYLISLSLRLFGEGIGALRLPSALLGGLMIIPFFALARRLASPGAALAASLLMAGNLWHLHFSRSGWENIQVPFYALMAAACLLWALDSLGQPARPGWLRWALFAGAGFWSAVGLYSYFSGRLILVVLLAYAPIAIRSDPANRRQILRGYGLLLGVAAALFAPMLPAVLGDIGFFNTRSATVQITQDPAFADDPLGTMLTQIRRNTAMFWDGDMSTKPDYHPVGSPFLDLLSRALLFAGLLLSLRRARGAGRPEIWLWWLLLGIGWFATQVLTRNTPDAARGTIFLPALLSRWGPIG